MTEKEKKQKDLFAYKAVLSAFLFKADHLSMVRLQHALSSQKKKDVVCLHTRAPVCVYVHMHMTLETLVQTSTAHTHTHRVRMEDGTRRRRAGRSSC